MAWHDLLRTSIEHEINSGSKDIIKKLGPILKKWQTLTLVSFATAFRLQNGILQKPEKDNIANGLEENGKKELYEQFLKLTKKPGGNMGKWPWDLLRKDPQLKSGIFPPKILLFNDRKNGNGCTSCLGCEIVPTAPVDKINYGGLQKDFTNGNDDNAQLSWKCYAAFPAILGDDIRGDEKKTVALVYILGTRREFLQQNRASDYGLVVGLTEKAFDTSHCLKPAADAILAAWNLLAVSPHVIADGASIAKLTAAQQLTHTFRTYVDAHALPTIEKLAAQTGNATKILEKVASISSLAGMMAFVAKDGINSNEKLRKDEVENYDLVAFIKEVLKDGLEKRTPPYTVFGEVNNGNGENFKGLWINRLYLRAALMEIVKNVRNEEPDDKDVSVCIHQENGFLVVKVTNCLSSSRPSSANGEKNVSGSKALDAFFRALGGEAEGYYFTVDGNSPINEDTASHYTWQVKYNLQAWKEKIGGKDEDQQDNGSKGGESLLGNEDIHSNTIRKLNTAKELKDIALRVLVLDDEVDVNNLIEAFQNLAYKDDWYWYEGTFLKNGGKLPLTCLYNATMQMEVVRCPSVHRARRFLLDEHFDIALLDIDFTSDPEGSAPALGGLLFGLGYINTEAAPFCILQVFTAKGHDLRSNNPDFLYLEELARENKLGKLKIELLENSASKNVKKMLQEAFYRWCVEVLGYKGKLEADPATLIKLGQFFYGGGKLENATEDEKKIKVCLDSGQRQGLRSIIPIATFDALIDSDDGKRKNLAAECMDVCGHAAVRNLFCGYAHGNILPYLKEEEEERRDLFNSRFDNACDLFQVGEAKEFRKKLIELEDIDEIKKRYRLTLADLCGTQHVGTEKDNVHTTITVTYTPDPKNPIYLYGLWEDPEIYKKRLLHRLADILINTENNNKILSIETRLHGANTSKESHGWTIKVAGNHHQHPPLASGGSLRDLRDSAKEPKLGLIATALILRNDEQKCYDVMRKEMVECDATCRVDCGFNSTVASNLELLIVLHHAPKDDSTS